MKFRMSVGSWIGVSTACLMVGIQILVKKGIAGFSSGMREGVSGVETSLSPWWLDLGVWMLAGAFIAWGLSAFMKAIDARIAKQQAAPALGRGASPVSGA